LTEPLFAHVEDRLEDILGDENSGLDSSPLRTRDELRRLREHKSITKIVKKLSSELDFKVCRERYGWLKRTHCERKKIGDPSI